MTATENPRPTMFTRLAAAMRGEVAATTIEAYRRAGSAAYQDLLDAEQLRSELASGGGSMWTARPHQASQLLCAWNAFVLQSLGDAFVDADYRADPRTVGYLPPVTAEQVAAFFGEVEQWSARARRAAQDATYDVAAQTHVPAELPEWVEAEPCPQQHLTAMLAAGRAMRERAQAALADLVRAEPPADWAADASRLRGMAAEADTAMSYAESLWSPHASPDVHERTEDSLKRAITAYHLLGQLLAMPALLRRPAATPATPVPARLPLPGERDFDPWCLTDPRSRANWKRDRAAQRAIEMLWRYDPEPSTTLAIQAQIDAALADGHLSAKSRSGAPLGNYYCCPWGAVYEAQRPVVIGARRLRPGQQFVFDVSAEEMSEGGEFVRRLMMGPFHSTDEVDYCDPEGD